MHGQLSSGLRYPLFVLGPYFVFASGIGSGDTAQSQGACLGWKSAVC